MTTKTICCISLAALLTSCFNKSNKTGTADDVVHSFICHSAKGDYLITHEEIFHATSKSSGPKGTYISGEQNFRYTVRDLQTGTQITREIQGDGENDMLPLMYSGEQIWFYSADKKLGLHARDARTFSVTVKQEQIEQANPSLSKQLASPKIYEAPQFYSYHPLTHSIVITDIQGHLFALDPTTLHASPTSKKSSFAFRSKSASTMAYFTEDKHVLLNGDPRKQLAIADNKSDDDYLNAKVLLEQNLDKLSIIAKSFQDGNNKEMENLQQRCDSFLRAYPVLKNEHDAYLNIKDYHIPNTYYSLVGKLQQMHQDSSYRNDKIIQHLSEMLLGGDSGSIYIMHANNITDTASLLITKIKYSGNKFLAQWTTLVPQIYFNPGKGIKKNPMADVFKAGNPQFDYEWYGTEGNVFAGIKMLFAFAIDTNTGKLLWKQQL